MERHKLIPAIAQRVNVTRFLNYREFLQEVYVALKVELGSYTYLGYADDLGFSKTNIVHLIIRGKRPLTSKSGEKVSNALDLRGHERKYFEELVNFQNKSDTVDREKIMRKLLTYQTSQGKSEENLDQLEFYKDWFNLVIFELAFTPYFTEDPKELAGLLTPKIRPTQARKSLELLTHLGLLARDQEGRLRPSQKRISTGDEIPLLTVTRYHQKMIELGKESLTTVPSHLRDISSIAVSIPESLIPELKKEISAFRKRLLSLAEQEDTADAVYQVNFQLFPVSRRKRAKS